MTVFYLIVTDRDKRLFNVLGPMTDDTEHINAVVAAQKEGRAVNCHTPPTGKSREEIISDFSKQQGLTYSSAPILA